MKKRCLKGLTFSLLVTSTMLSGCSTTDDYELRLIQTENKTTIDISDIKTTSVINFVEEVSSEERIIVGADNVIMYDFSQPADYKDSLDDSIVVEEDLIKADIEKDKESQKPQEVVEEPQEAVEEPQEAVEEPQEVVEEPQEEVEEPQEVVEESQEAEINGECVYSAAEHTISQTLINYVGAGNYAKWIANANPSCSNGVTIYDYMDYFNMTKSFFVNLTAYDSTYKDVNVYAH